jgi:hypothetical protein
MLEVLGYTTTVATSLTTATFASDDVFDVVPTTHSERLLAHSTTKMQRRPLAMAIFLDDFFKVWFFGNNIHEYYENTDGHNRLHAMKRYGTMQVVSGLFTLRPAHYEAPPLNGAKIFLHRTCIRSTRWCTMVPYDWLAGSGAPRWGV